MLDLITLNQQLIGLVLPEIFLMVFTMKTGAGIKFRFSGVPGYPNLIPIPSTFKVAIVTLIIYLLSPLAFEMFLGTSVNLRLLTIGFVKQLSLMVSLIAFNLIVIRNYVIGKKIDSVTAILGLIVCLPIILFFVL